MSGPADRSLARVAPLALAALVVLAAPSARADPPAAPPPRQERRAFDPSWQPEIGFADFLVTGTAVSVAVAAAITPPRHEHVTAHDAFDEHVRDTLRLPNVEDRYDVRDASDVGISLLVTWPFLVDGLVTAYYLREDFELAKKMAVVTAEVLAVNAAVQGVTNTIVSRERPFGRDCATGPLRPTADCEDVVRYRSFFSGHSSNAFASAATICIWHMKLGLLGPPGDALTCAGAYGVAAATATFRIMGDMHYATDVLTGAAIGSVLGFGLPLLHGRTRAGADARSGGLHVRLVPVGVGVGIGGEL